MAARFCLISQVTGTCATVTGTFKDSSSYGLCGSVECLKKSCRPIADIPVAHPLIEGVSVSTCAQAGHLHGQAALELITATEAALQRGIEAAQSGRKLGDVSHAIG